MDCAEEVAALKSALKDVPGIAELRFDVLNGKMTVLCAPTGCEADAVVSAVASTGMRAVLWNFRGDEGDSSFWQRRGRSILTAASGLFTTVGLVLHGVLHGSLLHALVGGGSENHIFPISVALLYGAGVVTGAWFVLPKALSSARRLRPDMNLLMTVAVIGAVAIGEWFEAAAVAFLFSLSLVLESWSVGRARHAISKLMDLSPTTARYICPNDGDIMEKPVEEVPLDVTVLVRPGEKVPLDGIVTKGETSINQAPITGESVPVGKSEGDEVFAGTINEEGAFEFKCTKVASDSTLARIIHMVEDAQSRRAASEQWVEKFARYYTPAMMLLALTVAVLPPLFGGSWSQWLYQALVMLVIACPCALVISTPVSIVAGLASAARAGVLIKGGVFLELPAKLRALALDKTGTLTYGTPEVQSVHAFNGHTEEEVLSRAASLESESGHPIARAILREAGRRGIVAPGADGLRDIPGKGTEALIDGKSYWIGSLRFMHEKGAETPDVHAMAIGIEDAAHTLVALGSDSHICGLIGISDRVREAAAVSVKAMQQIGVEHIVMLTGDNRATAAAVAEATGITEYQAEMLPEDKVAAVETLVEKYGHVAMIGDGVNDAPAMAVSSLGIAMGAAGTDAAIETADIALMSDDLSRIPWLIHHSRAVMRIIRQNIGFALGVKALFMLLALAGVATLWMAIAADMGASLLVIANALRLLRYSPGKVSASSTSPCKEAFGKMKQNTEQGI